MPLHVFFGKFRAAVSSLLFFGRCHYLTFFSYTLLYNGDGKLVLKSQLPHIMVIISATS